MLNPLMCIALLLFVAPLVHADDVQQLKRDRDAAREQVHQLQKRVEKLEEDRAYVVQDLREIREQIRAHIDGIAGTQPVIKPHRQLQSVDGSRGSAEVWLRTPMSSLRCGPDKRMMTSLLCNAKKDEFRVENFVVRGNLTVDGVDMRAKIRETNAMVQKLSNKLQHTFDGMAKIADQNKADLKCLADKMRKFNKTVDALKQQGNDDAVGTLVTDVDHNHGPTSEGKYPHFSTSSWSAQIGTTTWKQGDGNYYVYQVRGHSIIWSGKMTMWPTPNSPTWGSENQAVGHARRATGSAPGQWKKGDIMFAREADALKATAGKVMMKGQADLKSLTDKVNKLNNSVNALEQTVKAIAPFKPTTDQLENNIDAVGKLKQNVDALQQTVKAIAPLKQTTAKLQQTVDALGLQGNNFLADGALAQSMMEVRG